jgi:RNA polymerase sigma factor (sigma-70 family)
MRDGSIEPLLRDLAPQVLGAVVRRSNDFETAEDAVQEALVAAAEQWPGDGIPLNPRGWLIQVAMRRQADQVRREIARRNREAAVAAETGVLIEPQAEDESDLDPNDTLVLLLMCCHPALSTGSAIALTLRAVGGLTTREIAKAFMVPPSTMGQRISRAKETIRESGVRFSLPERAERAERLGAVLRVLYLMFNEGYTASGGTALYRVDLSNEAIRLTRAVRALLPESGEVAGLLALMLLTDARREARTGTGGELVPLDEQDRTLWDRTLIAEGIALVREALARGAIGEYQLLAAIAAVHDEAASAEETDWPEILALYQILVRITASPVAALNHAVAVAMVHGPHAGLERLAVLERDDRLAGSHRVDAARAHLLERTGDRGAAVSSYRAAAEKTTSLPERAYLLRRAARLIEDSA